MRHGQHNRDSHTRGTTLTFVPVDKSNSFGESVDVDHSQHRSKYLDSDGDVVVVGV